MLNVLQKFNTLRPEAGPGRTVVLSATKKRQFHTRFHNFSTYNENISSPTVKGNVKPIL